MRGKTNMNTRFRKALRAAECKIIRFYLDEAGTVVGAAELMEMDKAWLYRRMRTLGIEKPEAAPKPKPKPKSKATPEATPAPAPEPPAPPAAQTNDQLTDPEVSPSAPPEESYTPRMQLSLVDDPEQDTETEPDAEDDALTFDSQGATPPSDAG